MIDAADMPEPIGRVLKRALRGRDGETIMTWLRANTEARMLHPDRNVHVAMHNQGRFSLYLDIRNAMEKEDGRTDPIIAPTE